MAGAVKAEAVHVCAFGPLARDRVKPIAIGYRLMERGLERRHQRNLGQLLAQQAHGRGVGRVVRRRRRVHRIHRRQHVRRDAFDAAVPAAVYRLEPDGRHLRGICQTAALAVGQLIQAAPHGHGMVGHRRHELAARAGDLDIRTAFGRADPFGASARKLALVGHVVQPILEARRAQVGYQDLHRVDRSIRVCSGTPYLSRFLTTHTHFVGQVPRT